MKGKTKAQRVAAFLKKAGKKRYTAGEVATKCGCSAGYVKDHLDCWKRYRKQFVEPTTDELVRKYLSGVGKTIPRVRDVAEACNNRDPSVIMATPSWRAHVKKYKPYPKKELVETFLRGVWNESKKYTARQVAEFVGCSITTVETHPTWEEYQDHRAKKPADERVRQFLAKDKTGKKKYAKKSIAEALGLHESTVATSVAWQEYQNRIRQAEGKAIHVYRPRTKRLSPELESRINKEVARHKKRKITSGAIAEVLDSSKVSVQKARGWKKRRKQSAKPTFENLIRAFLFDENGISRLKDGRKYKRQEVAIAIKCGESTVTDSENWKEYQKCFVTKPSVKIRIKKFLAKDKTGVKGFTSQKVADVVGCSRGVVLKNKDWKKYFEKVKALRPKGRVEERIKEALQELLTERVVKPALLQVAEKARCCIGTVSKSEAWKDRHLLFPTLDVRIGKAIQELKAEGIPLPTKKQVAEKAKCKPATVNESPAWQRHRLESAPSPAGSPQSVIMPRIKEKTESDGKKTFTVDELKETLEEERERMNKPDNVHVVNQLTKKDIADAIAMFDGAYRAKAHFTEPPDAGVYGDVLRALMDSKNPDDKYRRWAMWISGMSCTNIAKSENPDWEIQYGREKAQELWESEADTIRKQVQRFEKKLEANVKK